MKEIELTQGYKAMIDDEDYPTVSAHSWCANVHRRKDGTIKRVYAFRRDRKRRVQYLHRFLLHVRAVSAQVDHRDGNGLNNQRYNLRRATQRQNSANQGPRHPLAQGGLKGVTWNKTNRKWIAQISPNRKNTYLGSFYEKLDAAYAYNVAALKLFGKFARLNLLEETP